MTFKELVERFTAAVEAGDGHALADCFHSDGTYHDYIYGAFTGSDAINQMLVSHFHGDARDFHWEMFDLAINPGEPTAPIDSGQFLGYSRYRFSFISTLPVSDGKRVAVDGIGQFRITDGRISEYFEVVNGGIAMSQLGHAPERMAKVFGSGRPACWRNRAGISILPTEAGTKKNQPVNG